MTLKQQQQRNIESILAPHLARLSECSNKSQRLSAYQTILIDREPTLPESTALSIWQSDKDAIPAPLFFSVIPIRALLQNPEQILGTTAENKDEIKEYIAQTIRTRIKRLKKNKVKPETMPTPTLESTAALLSCITVYLN